MSKRIKHSNIFIKIHNSSLDHVIALAHEIDKNPFEYTTLNKNNFTDDNFRFCKISYAKHDKFIVLALYFCYFDIPSIRLNLDTITQFFESKGDKNVKLSNLRILRSAKDNINNYLALIK